MGTENGRFDFKPASLSGLRIKGNVRDSETVQVGLKRVLIFTRNNDEIISIINER